MSQASHVPSSFCLRLCDRLIISGGCVLLILSPLTFGSVHLWAYSLMEGIVFFLVAVWMGKRLVMIRRERVETGSQKAGDSTLFRSPFVPMLLFLGILGFQLVPLPTTLLSLLSPAAHALYRQSLPGWPEQSPYLEWLTEEEAAKTKAVDRELQLGEVDEKSRNESGEWMPLSVAPALTRVALLKFLAYAGFFSLLLWYPIGTDNKTDAEDRFLRTIVMTVLGSGWVIASIALVQRLFWNGKILWFFVPYHWPGARPDIIPRASGPFVNSDHFANYLVLVFPLLLGALLSRGFLVSRPKERVFTLFGLGTLVVVLAGILLSLSRGGWISVTIALGLLIWSLGVISAERRALFFPQFSRSHFYRVGLFCVALCVLTFVLIGASGRNQIDQRLEMTLTTDAGLGARAAVWQDSLRMIRDFPLFGVGLGAWPELFPQYQRPPWSSTRWGAAHNDYLQCLAETGVIGVSLMAWFFTVVAIRIRHGLRSVSETHLPLLAGILAACGGMAVHSGGDFSLQIPANALLFSALAAIGVRMAARQSSTHTISQGTYWHVLLLGSTGIVALALCVIAIVQTKVPLRRSPEGFTSIAEARDYILAFPARRDGHMALVNLQNGFIPPAELRREFEIALWLAPLNPEVRDRYVTVLLEQEQEEAALREVQRSVFNSPLLSTHFYLTPEAIPSLDPPELQAIEKGMKQAKAAGLYGAADGLGGFYRALKRFAEAGEMYEEAGRKEPCNNKRVHYLLTAARAYIQGEDRLRAEPLLREAIQCTPQNPTLYRELTLNVFAKRQEFAAARRVVAEGARLGVAALPLLLSLSDTAKRVEKREDALAILEDALVLDPRSYEVHLRLGRLSLEELNFDRALLFLKKATQLQSDAAPAFHFLGRAEEGRRQYHAAREAYVQAVKLAPGNLDFQHWADRLQQKMLAAKAKDPSSTFAATTELTKAPSK